MNLDIDIANREEVLAEMSRCLYREWDRIAGDVLVDDYGRPDETMSMPKDTVFEITLDCWAGGLQGDEYALWQLYGWDKEDGDQFKQELKDKTFTYETYGY